MSYQWKYQEPTGPTINRGQIKRQFVYTEISITDERSQQEIDQERFDQWQELYDIQQAENGRY